MKVKHRIKVNKGKFQFYNAELFKRDLAQYEGQDINLTIKPFKKSRSDNQNRYYWGVVIKLISEELGYFAEEMHEILKQKFLDQKEFKFGKDQFIVTKSTSELSTKEFEDYLENIRQFAHMTLNIFIPLPNEVDY